MRIIKISVSGIEAFAELCDTDTAREIYKSLPFEGNVSRWGDEIRAYSPVNVFGKLEGNPKIFKKVKQGERVKVEKYQEV